MTLMARNENLTDTARNILAALPFTTEDEQTRADTIADIVLRAESILTQEWYRLMRDSMTDDEKRRMMNAIGAQWTR